MRVLRDISRLWRFGGKPNYPPMAVKIFYDPDASSAIDCRER
jgi:hypothetical protein